MTGRESGGWVVPMHSWGVRRMRIAKSLTLAIAGSMLMSGAAMAADPMPIVVAALPAATAPATGPEVVIDVTAGFILGAPSLYLGLEIGGLVDVRSASGLGVRFQGSADALLVPFFGGGVGGLLTLYKALGDLELGVWAGGGFSIPAYYFCCGGYAVGLSANYLHESARLYVSSENRLLLLPFFDLYSYTEAEFKLRDNITLSAYFSFYVGGFDGGVGIDVDLTDRIEVLSNLYYSTGGLDYVDFGAEFKLTDRFSVWSGLGFDLDPNVAFDRLAFGTTFDVNDELTIKSQFEFAAAPFAFDYVATWAELDHPIGTGPLSLTAELGVGFDNNLYAWGNIGIRYKLGGPEDHDDNRLFGDDSPF